MSWVSGFLYRHLRERRAMRRDAMSLAAPPHEHPCLGVGGRSIELSVGLGRAPDPGAFDLATDTLHDHVVARDLSDDELRAAANWLRDRWPDAASADSRGRLEGDLETLGA